MSEDERGTGRTTRQIQNCLDSCAEPNRTVAFVLYGDIEIGMHAGTLRRVADLKGNPVSHLVVRPGHCAFHLKNGSVLDLVGSNIDPKRYRAGREIDHLVFDHYVHEHVGLPRCPRRIDEWFAFAAHRASTKEGQSNHGS